MEMKSAVNRPKKKCVNKSEKMPKQNNFNTRKWLIYC